MFIFLNVFLSICGLFLFLCLCVERNILWSTNNRRESESTSSLFSTDKITVVIMLFLHGKFCTLCVCEEVRWIRSYNIFWSCIGLVHGGSMYRIMGCYSNVRTASLWIVSLLRSSCGQLVKNSLLRLYESDLKKNCVKIHCIYDSVTNSQNLFSSLCHFKEILSSHR